MKISIEYCVRWNYLPHATSLAAEIKDTVAIESTLIPGSRGVFKITVDDAIIFSKEELKRFPEPGEIASKLKTMV